MYFPNTWNNNGNNEIDTKKYNKMYDNIDTYDRIEDITDKVIDRLYYITSLKNYYRYDDINDNFVIIFDIEPTINNIESTLSLHNTKITNTLTIVDKHTTDIIEINDKIQSLENNDTTQNNMINNANGNIYNNTIEINNVKSDILAISSRLDNINIDIGNTTLNAGTNINIVDNAINVNDDINVNYLTARDGLSVMGILQNSHIYDFYDDTTVLNINLFNKLLKQDITNATTTLIVDSIQTRQSTMPNTNSLVNKSYVDTRFSNKQDKLLDTQRYSCGMMQLMQTPFDDNSAVSVGYLNTTLGTLNSSILNKQDTITSATDLIANTVTVSTVPSNNNHLTNKTYVDTQVATKQNIITSSTNLTANNVTVSNLPLNATHLTNKSYVDTQVANNKTYIDTQVATKQNIITSATDLTANTVTVSTVPSTNNHLTNKTYVDTQVATKQNIITSTTDLTVNTVSVPNWPTDANHLCNKSYIDAKVSNLFSNANYNNALYVLRYYYRVPSTSTITQFTPALSTDGWMTFSIINKFCMVNANFTWKNTLNVADVFYLMMPFKASQTVQGMDFTYTTGAQFSIQKNLYHPCYITVGSTYYANARIVFNNCTEYDDNTSISFEYYTASTWTKLTFATMYNVFVNISFSGFMYSSTLVKTTTSVWL